MDKTRIRPRAVALGVILGVALCLTTPYNNLYLGATPLAGGHFPLFPFILLTILTVLVTGLAKIFRAKTLLSGTELLVAWMLMVVVSGLAYTGLVRTFFINITALNRFASDGNRWDDVLTPLMPRQLTVHNHHAVQLLYNGLDNGQNMGWLEILRNIPWKAWEAPLVAWGVFILLCFMVTICLVNIFSRQWIGNERMNLPLLRLPYLMEETMGTGGVGAFFANPYLLAGLAVPVLLHTVNGLSFYVPSVPQIPTQILAGPYFAKTGLFSGFDKLKICLYPAFIGFAFLTARQISLSFWLFFILGCLLSGFLATIGYQIPVSALGVTFGPTLSRAEETLMIGAYGAFFFFLLWLARHHLWSVLREAFGGQPEPGRGVEWLPNWMSFWGLVAGLIALLAWCWYFGLPLTQSALLLGIFFMVLLVVSRVICQGGIAYFTLTAAPMDGLLGFFGSGFFSGAGLLLAAVIQKVQFMDLRESLMPSLFHAAKVGESLTRRRLYFAGLVLVLVLGLAVSLLAMLVLCHKVGMRDLHVEWETSTVLGVYDNVQRLIEAPSGPNSWTIGFASVGAVAMAGLVLAFQRFYWWPLHPVGYLTMYSSSMRILWFSFFLGWLCNNLTLRYGGVPLYRQVRMFFYGLIFGDFLMGGVFAVIGLYMGQCYLVLPS